MAWFNYLPFGVGKARELNVKKLVVGGDPMNGTAGTDVTASLAGLTASATQLNGAVASLASANIKKISQTILKAGFTDGGAAVGTVELTSTIPVGATVLFSKITNVGAFSGDTSAVLTIGDGTDADRYNTGTLDVFANLANGIATGVPSGVQYHDTAKKPVITVTTASDFTAVAATASVTVEVYYI